MQPVGATRTLVMNRCSEAPHGFPVAKTIVNGRAETSIVNAPQQEPHWMVQTALPKDFNQIFERHPTSVAVPPRFASSTENLPGVWVPGIFSMDLRCSSEWWYYVGSVETDSGLHFSIQIQLLRVSLPGEVTEL